MNPSTSPLNMHAFGRRTPLLKMIIPILTPTAKLMWTLYLAFGAMALLLFMTIVDLLRNIGSGSKSNAFGVLAVAIIFGLIPIVRVSTRKFRKVQRRMVLARFASDNGFSYTDNTFDLSGPGRILSRSKNKNRLDNIVGGTRGGIPFVFGNFFYMANYRTMTEVSYGIIQIQLPRHLPHILLDAKKNNFGGKLNISAYSSNQRLELEGNFSSYFDLYVPTGYERDALYFITPDLMQLLIEHGAGYDIEITENNMLIYCNQPYQTQQAETVAFIFSIIGLLGSKAVRNTRLYRDERVASRRIDQVAPAGRQLSRSKLVGAAGIIWIIIYLLASYRP